MPAERRGNSENFQNPKYVNNYPSKAPEIETKSVFGMYLECIWGVSGVYLRCVWSVSIWNVSGMYLGHNWSVLLECVWTVSIWNVSGVYLSRMYLGCI